MDRYTPYAMRGRNEGWRYALTLFLSCILAVAGMTGLFALLLLLHVVPPDLARGLVSPDNPTIFYPAMALIFGGWLFALIAAARLIQKKSAGDIIGAWRWSLYAFGFGLWLIVQLVLTLVDVVLAPSGFSLTINSQTVLLALLSFFCLAVQTFTEEFIFRGYLTQGALLLFRNAWGAALASGFAFALMHIPNGIPQAINALVLGVVCSMIAVRTGGIAFTSGLHLANNYFGAVIVVSGGDVLKGSPGLFAQNTPQLTWPDLVLASLAIALMLVPIRWSKFVQTHL